MTRGRVDGSTRTTGAELEAWLAETRAWAETELEAALAEIAAPPERLLAAMRHAVFGGGKRLRPALVRMICRTLGGSDRDAGRPAAAVELVHTYSLVHDDLPCMDDDDLRRGRPTCHKVYGEALAVLAGDALQAAAFERLARASRPAEMALVLARAAGSGGMVGGQVLDLEFAGRSAEAGLVRAIHAKKTAALISAAVELGALAAGTRGDRRAAIGAYGDALGLCFQAVDDVLDVTGSAATLGKTPGKDQRGERPTLVAALGLAGARDEARHRGEEAREAARALGFGPESLPARFVDYLEARQS